MAAQQGGAGSHDNQDQDAETPEYLTADRAAELVNAAVTSQLKRILPKQLEELKSTLTETISEAVASRAPQPKGEGDDGGHGDGQVDKATAAKLAAMEKKLQDATDKLSKAEEARVAAETKARNKEAQSALRSALADKVSAKALDVVVRDFVHSGRLVVEEDGTAYLKDGDQELSLADGVASWLKSPEAELFIPAPTNGRPGQGQPRGTSPGARGQRVDQNGLPIYDKPASTDEERVRRAEERARAIAKQVEQEQGSGFGL